MLLWPLRLPIEPLNGYLVTAVFYPMINCLVSEVAAKVGIWFTDVNEMYVRMLFV